MNLRDFIDDILRSRVEGESKRLINYDETERYENTLLMLFLAAQQQGYCSVTCYYLNGSKRVDSVVVSRIDLRKKIEKSKEYLEKLRTTLKGLSLEDLEREHSSTLDSVIQGLPGTQTKITTARKYLNELDKFYTTVLDALADDTGVGAGNNPTANAVRGLFESSREYVNQRIDSDQAFMDYAAGLIVRSNRRLADRLLEKQSVLRDQIRHAEIDVTELEAQQQRMEYIMNLLTKVFHIPSNWTIQEVDDPF